MTVQGALKQSNIRYSIFFEHHYPRDMGGIPIGEC